MHVPLYVLQTHGWDYATPPEEWLGALKDLVNAGKVRYIGVSNLCGWQLQKVVDLCKTGDYPPIVSLQVNLEKSMFIDVRNILRPNCINERVFLF